MTTSNWGLETVQIGAPGLNILTCTPQSETGAMTDEEVSFDYAPMSGTSAAAPHISGACALALGMDPGLAPVQLKKRLGLWLAVDQVLPDLCVSEGRLVLDKFLHLFEEKVVLNNTTGTEYDKIQDAIKDASSGDDIVAQAGGFYAEALDFLGKNIVVRSGDTENPDDLNAIDPVSTYIYDIDELGDGYGVVFNSGETDRAKLMGFTVDHAREAGILITGSSPVIESCYVVKSTNSGVYCENGSPLLLSSWIQKNNSLGDGAGVYAAEGSVMTIQDCEIAENVAVYSGGGVFSQDSNLVMDGCTVLANLSLDGFGGGVYSDQGNVEILNCLFSQNEDPNWEGGGLYAAASTVSLDNSTFSENLGYDGGAVYCIDDTELTVNTCRFHGNVAYYGGGAIGSVMSTVTLLNGLFVQNASDSWDGGALHLVRTPTELANCTFSLNETLSEHGRGGVMRLDDSSEVIVRDSILSDNLDVAVYVQDPSSSVTFDHCLFHNNDMADYENAATGMIAKLDDPNNTGAIPGDFMTTGNPHFVTGRLGDYYLSQSEAGQILDLNGMPVDVTVNPGAATSRAVDAGSALAADLGMNKFSTRTDNFEDTATGDKDLGLVDLGFHYNDSEFANYYVITGQSNPEGTGVVEPVAGYLVQYTQVLVTATVNDPDRYMFESWNNTDDDTRIELTDAGIPKEVQTNVVTMTQDRMVKANYETLDVELRVLVDEKSKGNGVVEPRRVFVPRGETVTIKATPNDDRFRVEWHNTNDDYTYGTTNTVTIEPPFKKDPSGREIKEVRVEFYTPRILNVPGRYRQLQDALNDSAPGDIVVLAPSSMPYSNPAGILITHGITIQSAKPEDPQVVAQTVIEGGVGFDFIAVEPNAVLNGVTFRNMGVGGANGANGTRPNAPNLPEGVPGGDAFGAAITCISGSPTIKNCVFTGCTAVAGNGGDGADTIADDQIPFFDEYAGHGGMPGTATGGAVACFEWSSPIFENCSFANNSVQGGNGGNGGDAGDPSFPGFGGGWDPRQANGWLINRGGAFGDPTRTLPMTDWDLRYSGQGGAVYVDSTCSPEFTRCVFANNTARGGVSGIAGTGSGYVPDTQIPWAIPGFGGAVYIGRFSPSYAMALLTTTPEGYSTYKYVDPLEILGPDQAKSEPRFVECEFVSNRVTADMTANWETYFMGYGGAVAAEAGVVPLFEKCTFTDNAAPIGGAIYVQDANIVLADCDLSANVSYHGGAVAFVGGVSTIDNSRLNRNVADEIAVYNTPGDPNNAVSTSVAGFMRGPIGQGGALWIDNADVAVRDTVMQTNRSTLAGGAGYIVGSLFDPYIPKFQNCLITGNQAAMNGGGLAMNLYAAPLLENCTIAGNQVGDTGAGGGLSLGAGSTPKVLNSIIWNNVGLRGSQIALTGENPLYTDVSAVLDIQYSDVQSPSGGVGQTIEQGTAFLIQDTTRIKGWDATTRQWDPSTHNINANPLFVMGYYLSQTDAGQLVQSPCVDAGDVDSDSTSWPMDAYTTRTGSDGIDVDGVFDSGRVDLGYHYQEVAQYWLTTEVLPSEDGLIHGVVTPQKKAVFSNLQDNVVVVTAIPDPGYKVKQWAGTDNNNTISTVNTVTMTQDVNVTVTFEKAARYYFTTEVVNTNDGRPHGQLVPQNGWVDEGTTVKLTAMPEAGYEVSQWIGSVDDTSKSAVNFVLVDANNLVVRVKFAALTAKNVLTVPSDYTTIQAALTAAGTGDTIVVDPGVYQSGEGSFLITLTKDVTITSRFPSDPCCVAATILDGYANDPAHPLHYGGIVVASNVGRDTVINGLTFRNCGGQAGSGVADDGDRAAGHPDGYDGQPGYGGAMLILPQASPTIKNCVFQSNFMIAEDGGNGENADDTANAGRGGWGGWSRGGAIYCASKSSPIFINCSILDNYAQGGNGGNGGDGALNNDVETLPNYGGNYTPGQRVFIDSLSTSVQVVNEDVWKLWTWDFSETYKYQLGEDAIVDANAAAGLVLTGELGPYLGDERDYTAMGGGVYCGTLSQVTFVHCEFSGNHTYGGLTGIGGLPDGVDRNLEPLYTNELPSYGGAVYCDSDSIVTFEGCTFRENEASAIVDPNNGAGDGTDVDPTTRPNPYMGYGGGVSTDVNAKVVFTDCNFMDNKADIGGGIYVKESLADVADSNFVRNEALQGGALAGTGGDIIIADCNVVANLAIDDSTDPNDDDVLALGAGMYLSSCPAQVTDSNFFSNITPGSGGAVYIRGNKPTITNCLFRNNGAGHDGGALSVNHYAVTTIRNATFYHNLADPNILGGIAETGYGGAIFCGTNSRTFVTDSIFFQNTAHLGGAFAVMSGKAYNDDCASLSLYYCTVTTGPNDVYTECDDPPTYDHVLWGVNPLFRSGPLGNHYLSANSPAVDAGSTTSYQAGMTTYTTQVDPRKDTPDTGKVDIGYHYKLAEPCRVCDLIKDGRIDISDFGRYAELAQKWMGQECNAANHWCDGADLTYDFKVDANDRALLEVCRDVSDVTPPKPNPAKWSVQPYIEDGKAIMRAQVAEDGWWLDQVEYYFQNVSGNGHDSGWQSSPVYVDDIAMESEAYGYRLKVRDPSENETQWSKIKHASPYINIAPVGPLSLSLLEAGVTYLQLLAEQMFDADGVQYYIEIDDEDYADSGWFDFDPSGLVPDPNDPNNLIVLDPNDPNMAGPNYRFTQLQPSTTYRFRVKARDKSEQQLETAYSDWFAFTTLDAPENLPPTPNPLTWDTAIDANGFDGTPRIKLIRVQAGFQFYGVTMTSIVATDADSPEVEYFFECTNGAAFSSGWVLDPIYTTPIVGTEGAALSLRFRVKARDQAGNETQWSEELQVTRGQGDTTATNTGGNTGVNNGGNTGVNNGGNIGIVGGG
ncbi:MAG: right-handed parallel beta-helix repeat-containing protein [Phycisphaerae bacterium]|nr:right-handed parallel beta-helix repeat-containing protein [Phycisphaerae bacterium]